ncbi:MAG: hypothetical protein OEW48_15780 [Phycisphaerae bacterium]|nr:hypothetical protein [Phycisphaerae bacterium]
MINAIITTVIGSLILLAIGLSLKIAQLTHRLHLAEKENEQIRKKQAETEEEILNLKKKNSDLNCEDGFASGSQIR